MSSVITYRSTTPFAIVATTATETNSLMKLKSTALVSAMRGLSARVETLVAIELACRGNRL